MAPSAVAVEATDAVVKAKPVVALDMQDDEENQLANLNMGPNPLTGTQNR